MADDAPTTASARDYRETVFLPETPFPMRAGLPQKEPEILARWEELGLFAAMRRARQDASAPLYVLHDGPPYANGALHIGHALNKTLKDFVVRSRFALGYDVDYVPGWDCHGLPIEWKIEEEIRAKGMRKDEVSVAEFRTRCRAFAAKWIDLQRTEFKRLGVLGRWEDPYLTMDFTSEAKIVGEFHKFLMSGQLYRGSKPVMWSPVERTALADAEVEYHDHVSPTVWVKFPVTNSDPLNGASIVIWTTTPWTMPANRAISFNPDVAYGLYEVQAMEEGLAFEPWAKPGDRLIVADKLAPDVAAAAKISEWTKVQAVDPSGLIARHPLAALDPGYGFDVPLLAGAHVTDDAGTGFVHTAPGHGQDDYQVWLDTGHSRDSIPDTVDPDGAYYPHVPLFAGLKVLETEGKKSGKFGPANGAVMDKLIEAGNLLARGRVEHSYPHSWRSKAPVIFRNTPQWFVRVADDGLRATALAAIDATEFFPAAGKTRLRSMVENRPDWLISRQRAWGSPLAMFVDKTTGEPLRDEAVNGRILKAISEEGADAWFVRPDADFLGNGYDPGDYEKIEDILDVWFDSGSTHSFVLEGRDDSRWPADLYLEGSDQHRGWFQSSLLEACGTRGRAPFNAVLTHGFVLDENGEKMSKSRGNTTEPQTVTKESGADILRLWVAMSDYSDDLRIGKTILQTTVDAYRKLRNTLRYLLGAVAGFDETESLPLDRMEPLERFILHRLWELDEQVRAAYEAYRFQDVLRPIVDFCTGDLSSFYFDIRKDSLYCDRPDADRRRATRTVMDAVFERLTIWLAPLAPFTMEEVWTTRYPDAASNCLRVFPETPDTWRDNYLPLAFDQLKGIKRVVTGELERKRQDKIIGSSLDAHVTIYLSREMYEFLFELIEPAELFIVSQVTLVWDEEGPADAFEIYDDMPMLRVVATKAQGAKCARSWRILPEVGTDPRYPELSLRDADAVAYWDARR